MRYALALLLIFAPLAAETASGDVIDLIIGDDDGFGGTQGSTSVPGQPFSVFGSPFIAPGNWSGAAGTDATTTDPWTPYVFTFSFAVSLPQHSCVGAAQVRIQHGSVGRRTNGTGFGFAPVTAAMNGVALPPTDLWPTTTGAAGSQAEESVKITVVDVSALLQPGSSGILTVTIDGSLLTSAVDQFAIDFVALHIEGPFGPCAPDFDCNGIVNGADLGILLASWGSGAADLNGDGNTDGADLGLLLAAWGSCG